MSSSLDPTEASGDITIPRGPNGSAGRRYTLTILKADGTAQDMTGASLSFEITSVYVRTTAIKTYAIGTGITFADLTTGIGVLTIDSGDFSDRMAWPNNQSFYWALWITLSGDAASPYQQAYGTIKVADVA